MHGKTSAMIGLWSVSMIFLFLFPLVSEAAILTGADLPGLGQTLTITENTQFVIGSGQTAAWGGTISNSGFTVDFLNRGSIAVNGAVQNAGAASFNFSNEGNLTGSFNLTNTAQFSFSNSGTSSGNFNIANTGGGIFNILNTHDVAGINFNINTSAATTYIDNFASLSGNINLSHNNSGSTNILNNGTLGGVLTGQNNAGQINFQSNGEMVLDRVSITNTGRGTLNIQNNGKLDTTLNLNTYGAETNLANNGQFRGTLNALDQNDDTHIFNSGTISESTLNFTANGGQGRIGLQNNGVIGESSANINANYGGGISFNNLFGSMDFEELNIQALGASHGVDSSFYILYARHFSADELNVYGPQDPSFLADGLDRTFVGPNGINLAIFDGADSEPEPEPVPEPATLLLLGSALAGIWGTRRRRI